MFALKKIVTSFLIPPGILVLLLFVCCVYFISRRRWKEGFASCAAAIVVWGISTVVFADILLMGLEYSYLIPKSPRGDVIVLLGGGIYDGVPDLSGIGSPSVEMCGRIITAVRLQKLLGIPVIVSSGRVFESQTASESAVVKRFLEDLGVPHERIIAEDKSRDTIENAKYTALICNRYGYKRPILVTSAFHMKRSVISFEKAGLNVLPVPASFRTWNKKIYGWQDFLPGGFEGISIALHEYLGLIFYKFAY
jgi:uncharacterized SAM-binding protein YcdF (DUF218 family)